MCWLSIIQRLPLFRSRVTWRCVPNRQVHNHDCNHFKSPVSNTRIAQEQIKSIHSSAIFDLQDTIVTMFLHDFFDIFHGNMIIPTSFQKEIRIKSRFQPVDKLFFFLVNWYTIVAFFFTQVYNFTLWINELVQFQKWVTTSKCSRAYFCKLVCNVNTCKRGSVLKGVGRNRFHTTWYAYVYDRITVGKALMFHRLQAFWQMNTSNGSAAVKCSTTQSCKATR